MTRFSIQHAVSSILGFPFRLLVSLGAVVAAVGATLAASAIENPSFERVDEARTPIGWQVDCWRSGATVESTKAKAWGGETALVIRSEEANDVRLIQTVAVDPGTVYRLRGWVATENVSADRIGANLCLMGFDLHSVGSMGNTSWHPVDLVFRTHDTQKEVTVGVRLGYFGDVATGCALFDDLTLEEVTDPNVPYQQIRKADADISPGRSAERGQGFWLVLAAAATALLGVVGFVGLALFPPGEPDRRGNQGCRLLSSTDGSSTGTIPKGGLAHAPAGSSAWCRWFAWGATAVFAVLLGLVISRHEMWRDEINSWLLARDTPRWLGLFAALKYEGQPALWNLLLWPLCRLTWNPVAMQALNVAIASTTAWLIFRRAPFHWSVRLVLPFGYFLFYEWGVISRSYGLSALLFVLFCVVFDRRWKAFPWAALALALACHTNVYSLLFVMVLFPVLIVDFAVAVAGRYRAAERVVGRVVAGFALIALGMGTAVIQINPPADSGIVQGWKTQWEPERAQAAAISLTRAYVPVPSMQADFWNSCRLIHEGLGGGGRLRMPSTAVAWFVLAAMATVVVLLLRRPWPLVPWVLGTWGIFVFSYVKYLGYARHHGFHFLWLVVIFWMARSYQPWPVKSERLDRVWGAAERWGMHLALAALCSLQLWATVAAARADWVQAFSASPLAATWLRENGFLTGKYCFAGQAAPEISAVVGHAQLPSLRYTYNNLDGSYMIWKGDFDGRLSGRALFQLLDTFRKEQGKDLVFLSSKPIDVASRPSDMREVAIFDPPAAEDAVWIYVWPRDDSSSINGPRPVPGLTQ